MAHNSAEVVCNLRYALNSVQVVNAQHHGEAHDVWQIQMTVPAGKTVCHSLMLAELQIVTCARLTTSAAKQRQVNCHSIALI